MDVDQKSLIKGHGSQYVKLNVGGHLYYTTIGTLTKHNDTMLSAMFSGRMEVLTDGEGKGMMIPVVVDGFLGSLFSLNVLLCRLDIN